MFDRCLYFNTKHLARVIEKIMKDAFSELDLSPSHAYLLRLILNKPGLLQKEIGNTLHLEKSTVTRFLDKMVNEGYIKRQTKIDKDVRLHYIYPTQKSHLIAEDLERIGNSVYTMMKDKIGLETLTPFVQQIKSVAHKL